MTENGRLVVPVRLRRLLGIEGTRAELFFRVRGDEVKLTTKMQALRRAQARLAETADVPPGLCRDSTAACTVVIASTGARHG